MAATVVSDAMGNDHGVEPIVYAVALIFFSEELI